MKQQTLSHIVNKLLIKYVILKYERYHLPEQYFFFLIQPDFLQIKLNNTFYEDFLNVRRWQVRSISYSTCSATTLDTLISSFMGNEFSSQLRLHKKEQRCVLISGTCSTLEPLCQSSDPDESFSALVARAFQFGSGAAFSLILVRMRGWN